MSSREINKDSPSPLDPGEALVYGVEIDRDLGISDRGRRKLVTRGVIPPPDGYFGGRAFWFAATYARFKAELRAGKHGQRRRFGERAMATKIGGSETTVP